MNPSNNHMKTLFLALTFLISYSLIAQEHKINVQVDYHDLNENLISSKIKTINSTFETLDISFYKKHFAILGFLPNQLVDCEHTDTIIVSSTKRVGKVEFPGLTYQYDSLARLIRFSFTPNLLSSITAHDYNLTYNNKNQLIKLTNSLRNYDRFLMSYNESGSLISIYHYRYDKLLQSFKLIE